MSEVETIGKRIKRERLKKGLTQRELAGLIGVGVPHVSKIEADRESPSDELLTQIAKVFEIEVDELFLVARRLPEDALEMVAAEPEKMLEFLRTWKKE